MVRITITLKYTLNAVKDCPLSQYFFPFSEEFNSVGKKPTLGDTSVYTEMCQTRKSLLYDRSSSYNRPFISSDLTTKEFSAL